jgi:recombination protein RecT
MSETKEISPKTDTLASMLADVRIKKRFEGILGSSSAGFMSSILSLYNANQQLKEADAGSIIQAAAIAATLNLPINPNLGFAFIIPYGKKAQFQMGYKGFVQLAIRSRQYKTINVSEVYRDEILKWDPLTGVFEATPYESWKLRSKGDFRDIVGYMAYFELLGGFEKTLYMTNEQLVEHGKKYSKSYAQGMWTQNPHVMKIKTVVKLLLSKWGALSVEMQKAMEVDQGVVETTGEISYDDRPAQLPEPAKPTGAEKKINEDQFKLLCARASKYGLETSEVDVWIKQKFGVEHKHDLTVEQLTETIKWIEQEPPAVTNANG